MDTLVRVPSCVVGSDDHVTHYLRRTPDMPSVVGAVACCGREIDYPLCLWGEDPPDDCPECVAETRRQPRKSLWRRLTAVFR